MKKTYNIFVFLVVTMILNSCVSSLYPVSENENDFVFRDDLLGRWTSSDRKTQVIVQQAVHKKYRIAIIDKENRGENMPGTDSSFFTGFLVPSGKHYFLDCTPDMDRSSFACLGEETRSALLPLHFIYKLQSTGSDQISISGMDMDSMQKFMDHNRVRHEKPGRDHILLTAGAGELQEQILSNKESAFLFRETIIFNREK